MPQLCSGEKRKKNRKERIWSALWFPGVQLSQLPGLAPSQSSPLIQKLHFPSIWSLTVPLCSPFLLWNTGDFFKVKRRKFSSAFWFLCCFALTFWDLVGELLDYQKEQHADHKKSKGDGVPCIRHHSLKFLFFFQKQWWLHFCPFLWNSLLIPLLRPQCWSHISLEANPFSSPPAMCLVRRQGLSLISLGRLDCRR